MMLRQAKFRMACGLAVLLACTSPNRGGQEAPPKDVAIVGLVLAPSDFDGSSVRITGSRRPFSDSKYRCENTVNVCFDFASDGTTSAVAGLCPSEDVPRGTWDFSYEVFDAPGCAGDALPNFRCQPTLDEALPAGVVTTNYVLCASRPARKTWDFDSVGVDPDCPEGATCIPVTSPSP